MLPMKKLQILLVDGDFSTRQIAHRKIKIEVLWTGPGEAEILAAALELIRIRKFDLIVLDCSLAEEARAPIVPIILAATPKARLVMLISNPSEQAVREDL